jgi:hypothetical protein
MKTAPPRPFTRRRFLAAAIAAACGAAVPALARVPSPARRSVFPGPLELPLSAAELYAPHDLAG